MVASDLGQPLVGSHPVYDYLAEGYGLDMKSVHWEPDEIPTDEQWNELLVILENYPSQWMIWEAKPAGETVAKLRSIGIKSLVLEPCGNVPDQGDFL